MKIWYQSTLDFRVYPNYEKALNAHAVRTAGPNTEVLVRGRGADIGTDLSAADLIGTPIAYHSIVAPTYIRALLEAESLGADAFVVASFSEPLLPELRSLASIPVVSMSEVTFMAAAMNAPKIAMVTLNPLVVPFIEKSSALHRWNDRLTGIHLLPGHVTERDLDNNWSSPTEYLELLADGAREAIAAGAQVIVPAEGVLGVLAAENGLMEVDGVPVVDAIGTSILFAELAVSLKERTGLSQSRLAYPRPGEHARNLIANLHGQSVR